MFFHNHSTLEFIDITLCVQVYTWCYYGTISNNKNLKTLGLYNKEAQIKTKGLLNSEKACQVFHEKRKSLERLPSLPLSAHHV